MLRQVLMWIGCALSLAGCANQGNQHLFERDPAAIDRATKIAGDKARSTVYFVSSKNLAQAISRNPQYPLHYAVDGTMLAVMPLGSYAVLSLEPGKHTFTCLFYSGQPALFKFKPPSRFESEFDLVAAQTYYIDSNKWPIGCRQPVQLDAAEGAELVAKSELAKLIHRPVSVDQFINRIVAEEENRQAAKQWASTASSSAPQFDTTSLQDALPSEKQVGDFLEVLATVALIALVIVGAGLGGAGNAGTSQPNYVSPPAIHQSMTAVRPMTAWQTSSGSVTQVVNTSTEKTIYNSSTGVRYNITGDRISGSDGSHYLVAGSALLSRVCSQLTES